MEHCDSPAEEENVKVMKRWEEQCNDYSQFSLNVIYVTSELYMCMTGNMIYDEDENDHFKSN